MGLLHPMDDNDNPVFKLSGATNNQIHHVFRGRTANTVTTYRYRFGITVRHLADISRIMPFHCQIKEP